jgi:hypothetical protein
MDSLQRARSAAAHYLGNRGYPIEAGAIRNGRGDDYAEVRIALQMLAQADDHVAGIERALARYADPSFWDKRGSGLSDAALDAGTIARHALAGKALPGRYHD